MTRVLLVNYGSGNLHSAEKALVRAAADHGIDADISVGNTPEAVAGADRIVLPGVGAFAACMERLSACAGLIDALEAAVHQDKKPFLGICVGMQLLADRGQEYGGADGLGWIPGEVIPLDPHAALKIPHMGWNDVKAKGHAVLPEEGVAYFVHSFRFVPRDEGDVIAHVEYGSKYPAAIARENIMGVQFHPEKSQGFGLGLLANFMKWTVV